jgi:hypothetical protein
MMCPSLIVYIFLGNGTPHRLGIAPTLGVVKISRGPHPGAGGGVDPLLAVISIGTGPIRQQVARLM